MKHIFTLFLSIFIAFTATSQGLDFDGGDDFVRIPGNAAVMNGSAFTFETYLKPRTHGSEISSIATRGSGDNFYLYIEPMGGGMMPGEESEPTEWIIMCDLWSMSWDLNRTAYAIDGSFFNNWHHIAATYNGSMWTLYIDGNMVNSIPVMGAIANKSAEPLYLGMYQNMWNFAGVMDEVRIWNYARSQFDITSNMKKQVAHNSAGLVAYYTFNQGIAFGNNTGLPGLTDASPTHNNATMHNFSLSGSSSNFLEGQPDIVTLPLHITSFTAKEENNVVVLNWKSEEKNSFAVERSSNGGNFVVIGHVTVNASNQYQFTDGHPVTGTNVYRLSSTSLSGRKEYSASIVIKTGMISALKLYPNPATDVLQVQLRYSGAKTASVIDMSGKRVKTIQLPAANAFTYLKITVDISALAPGSYFLEMDGQQVKFVKQ